MLRCEHARIHSQFEQIVVESRGDNGKRMYQIGISTLVRTDDGSFPAGWSGPSQSEIVQVCIDSRVELVFKRSS
jgi:hypothetical protein